MADHEVLKICNHLKNISISLAPDNPWLIGCIEWYKSQNDVVNVRELQEYVCNQWLLADLHDIQEACLPTINNQDVFCKLTGKYAVQVNWIRDVGQSSYSQLKNLQVSSETESNETFTVDKPEKWEPRPTRMYMLEITDGVTTLRGMEYARINKLQEPFFPGTKILISGPLECRRGVLLLQENNVMILGGEVFSLLVSNSTENILARSLNIEDQSVNQPIQNTVSQVNVPTRGQHFSAYRDTTPIPHSNNINEDFVINTAESQHNRVTNTAEILASDEDEELLLQINSDVLQPDRLSRIATKPIIGAINNSSNSRFSNKPNDQNFKRLDGKYSNDNQPVTQTNINQSVLPSDSQINRLKSVRRDYDEVPNYPNKKFNSLNVEETNTFRRAISASEIHNQSSSDLQPSGSGLQSKNSTYSSEHDLTFDDDEDIFFASLEDEPQFPYCKQIQGTVQSLSSKLKIRDGEWTITAMITDGKTSFDVGFSSEVLEEIFGFSAAEVQSKRGEMASNPAIKEKINMMLKDGQQKLKSMKCIMTVEFPSASETPKVVAVDL